MINFQIDKMKYKWAQFRFIRIHFHFLVEKIDKFLDCIDMCLDIIEKQSVYLIQKELFEGFLGIKNGLHIGNYLQYLPCQVLKIPRILRKVHLGLFCQQR